MKYLLNIFKLSFALLVASCTTEEKDLPQARLVPVYQISVNAPLAVNNTLSGYKSVDVPINIHVYKEKDLVIQYPENNKPVNFDVVIVNQSSGYIPAGDNLAVAGTYQLSYTTEEINEVTNEENGEVTKTHLTTSYELDVNRTDTEGNALVPAEGLGITIHSIKTVTKIATKQEGDVSVAEQITPATDNVGEISTTIVVDNQANTTTTITKTTASALCEVSVIETEVYN
ncbi:hypothetical protein [Ochrovirga pacifica]|uniref:hypothetical protein n=1 Tax=Ochrovirga pacifica TaxID=1042376 RepID=UPI0002558378|nr:hypothetical protein [Ochrovirga pacifica]